MKKFILISAVALTASMTIYSCGGGGGESTGNNTGSISIQPISNPIEAGSSVYTAVTLSNLIYQSGIYNPIMNQEYDGGNEIKFVLIDLIKSNLKNNVSKIKSQTFDQGEENCSGGGKVSYKYTWTNRACKQLEEEMCWKNNTITFEETYSNCTEYGTTMNGYLKGQITFDANGNENGYIEVPNSFYIKYNQNELTFRDRFRLEYRYTDGLEEGIDLIFKSGNLKTVLSGSVQSDVIFKDLIYRYVLTTNTKSLSINGYYYENICYKKWYHIQTDKPIVYYKTNYCPREGKMGVNNSLYVEATASGGIKISDAKGNVLKEYAKCQDYEAESKSAMCK